MPGENIQGWSTTATLNGNSDTSINWAEGQTRASVNNSARSMMAAHAKDRDLKNGSIVTSGSANAQTFLSGLTYTTIPTGLRALLKIGPTLTNTDAMTLNMDGIAPTSVKDPLGEDLKADAWRADTFVEIIFSGTNWIMLSSFQAAITPPPPPVTVINNVTTVVNVPVVEFIGDGFDTSFASYQMVITNVVPTIARSNLMFQIAHGTPPVFDPGGLYVWVLTINRNGAVSGALQVTPGGVMTSEQSVNPALGTSGQLEFFTPSEPDKIKMFRSEMMYLNEVLGNIDLVEGLGYENDNTFPETGHPVLTPITGLRFLFTTGDIASGTFTLYANSSDT